ncbi:MAG: hypothetical protein V9E94_14425 [Microthrixaceae bacterium]
MNILMLPNMWANTKPMRPMPVRAITHFLPTAERQKSMRTLLLERCAPFTSGASAPSRRSMAWVMAVLS